jgi:AraC-like DNA-binding protein
MPRAHDPSSERLARASGIAEAIPATRSDLLSELLTLIRLRGQTIYTADLSAPWALAFPSGEAHFHFVAHGRALLAATGSEPVEVAEGELLLLPRGQGHSLSDVSGVSTSAIGPFSAGHFDADRLSLRHGGGGEAVKLISGTFRFDRDSSPIVLSALPTVIRVSRFDSSNAPWLEALVHFLLAEAHQPAPGSAIMISRLIDVMVVQTLRTWAAAGDGIKAGWLGGIGDLGIERALSALHTTPMRDWSVHELARIAAMSRSVFAERFTDRIGEPPLRYLKHWRLGLAADMLKTGALKVGDVARRCGYQSDAAFSRAYKARFGHSPIVTLASAIHPEPQSSQ